MANVYCLEQVFPTSMEQSHRGSATIDVFAHFETKFLI